ncbi:MAG: PQQ-binding-like beta-propeller repeat protein [Myxococcales bacterium]|nr:PQQ-binding-like beta-propeller repeat protein [Myxococcales bacterium]
MSRTVLAKSSFLAHAAQGIGPAAQTARRRPLRWLFLVLSLVSFLPACIGTRSLRAPVPVVRSEFAVARDILRMRWSKTFASRVPFFSYKPQEFATAEISDDGSMVFIGSSKKTLFALSQRTGEVRWQRTFDSSLSSHPLFLKAGVAGPQALLLVGEDAGQVSALVADTGEPRWTYRARGPVQNQPVLAGSLLYVTSNEGRIYALDVRTGAWRWQYEREATDTFSVRGQAAPLVVKDRIFIGFPDGYLSCLNAETGEVLWNRPLAGDASRFIDADGAPGLIGDTLVVSCYASGLFGLDVKDGSVRWRYEIEAAGPLTVDVEHERIYVSSATQGLFCLDKKGRKLWQQVLQGQGELSRPILWGPYLLVSAAQSGLHIADAESGELLQFFAPGQGATAAPMAKGRDVYLLSNAGDFFALTRTH